MKELNGEREEDSFENLKLVILLDKAHCAL